MKILCAFLIIFNYSWVSWAQTPEQLQSQHEVQGMENGSGVVDAAAASSSGGGVSDIVSKLFKGMTEASDPLTPCIAEGKATSGKAPANLTMLTSEASIIKTALNSCLAKARTAQMACLESVSPHIQQAAGIGGGLLSGIGMVSGARDKCQKTGDAADTIKKILMAYNAACGGMKMMCESTCSNLQQTITAQYQSAEKKRAACKDPACVTKFETEWLELTSFGQLAHKSGYCINGGCGKYAMNLISAGLGIAEMAKQKSTADQCVAQLTNPAMPTDVNCSDPANEANVKCICMKNPRAYGCGPSQEGTDGRTDVAAGNPSNPNINGGPGPFGGPPPVMDTSSNSGGTDGSSGGPSGGGGTGGGGIAGGGGGGRGGPSGGQAAGKKGFDTNIFSTGGAGGGARTGGGGGWADKDGKYEKYAPTKEQLRKIAAAKEISGKGKTNWEKVRETFISNRKTFIGR